MSDLRMYILVNQDIKISKGKLAGQVGHAVSVLFFKNMETEQGKELIERYMTGYQKKIILKCPQEKLEELEQEGHIVIRDAGFTELEKDTLTCATIGIMEKDEAPQWVGSLKLL